MSLFKGLKVPARQVLPSHNELRLRCKCGHMKFLPIVRPTQDGTGAQIVALECNECHNVYKLDPNAMLERGGSVGDLATEKK